MVWLWASGAAIVRCRSDPSSAEAAQGSPRLGFPSAARACTRPGPAVHGVALWPLKAENHGHLMAIYFMHYNFVRLLQTLRVMPAIAAGVSKTLWSLTDMVLVMEEWEPHQNWPKRLRDYIAHIGRKSEKQPPSQAQTGQKNAPQRSPPPHRRILFFCCSTPSSIFSRFGLGLIFGRFPRQYWSYGYLYLCISGTRQE